MSLILCPECGAKISNKATACPHCGYKSNGPSRPISEQDKFELVPIFQYDIEEWNPNRGELSVISYADNKSLIQYFGNWKNIKTILPSLAETIKAMASRDKILVADIEPYIKSLIDKGIYRLSIDKMGKILPTIRDSKEIVKQVRLKWDTLTPELSQPLNTLSMQAVMAQILDEIEYVGDAIREIHIELQNDRIAMTESSRDKLLQARKIQDAKLREIAILNIVGSATDAKRVLMRNFAQNLDYITEHSQKSTVQLAIDFKGEKDVAKKASDAFQDLVSITNAVQIECVGYSMLGEYESGKECLIQFKNFIMDNKLDEIDTLRRLNESLEHKQIEAIDEFSVIASRITSFEASGKIGYHIDDMIMDGG
jgi:hypothetical protein